VIWQEINLLVIGSSNMCIVTLDRAECMLGCDECDQFSVSMWLMEFTAGGDDSLCRDLTS
jgi:hypothetical protein